MVNIMLLTSVQISQTHFVLITASVLWNQIEKITRLKIPQRGSRHANSEQTIFLNSFKSNFHMEFSHGFFKPSVERTKIRPVEHSWMFKTGLFRLLYEPQSLLNTFKKLNNENTLMNNEQAWTQLILMKGTSLEYFP